MAAIILSAWPSAIPYRVRRVPRGRRLKVRVDPEHGVEVLLPAGAPLRAAAAAVAELEPWIERAARARARGCAPSCAAPGTLPYLDERLALVAAGRAHAARTAAATSCWCPPARARARRSSAGTGAPRARRSAGGSTAPRAASGAPLRRA